MNRSLFFVFVSLLFLHINSTHRATLLKKSQNNILLLECQQIVRTKLKCTVKKNQLKLPFVEETTDKGNVILFKKSKQDTNYLEYKIIYRYKTLETDWIVNTNVSYDDVLNFIVNS